MIESFQFKVKVPFLASLPSLRVLDDSMLTFKARLFRKLCSKRVA